MDLDCETYSLTGLEGESILNIASSKELIDLVRVNECLWRKRCQSFKDVNLKSLCWANVGKALANELSGAEAEREFYKLRQKFGREYRKEKDSAPRSGAGAADTAYASKWDLYKDLEFLKDAIRPRRAISNFTLARPSVTPSPPIIIQDADTPSTSYLTLADADYTQFSGSDLEAGTQRDVQSHVPSRKRSVPSPDHFYKKKKREDSEMATALSAHYKNLNKITDAIGDRSASCAATRPETPPGYKQDPLFMCLGSAVQRVPEQDQLTCIIEMLEVAKKYEKKKNNIIL